MRNPAPALLEVRGLRTLFRGEQGEARAVDGVDFQLQRGRTLGIVGESGCGKSVTALSIMGLVPQPPGRIAAGEVLFEGEDLLKSSPQRLRDLRGDKLAMIFQEPMTSLNPAFTVGDQISETILRHRKVTPAEARAQAIEMLRRVRMPSPERRALDYPHQLSGGMLKRVELARALVVKPEILYMDEPLSALDALTSIQMRIELLRILAEERHTCVLITHDVDEAIHLANRILVLSARPATIQAAFDVPFPHPRNLLSPEAIALKASVLRELGL